MSAYQSCYGSMASIYRPSAAPPAAGAGRRAGGPARAMCRALSGRRVSAGCAEHPAWPRGVCSKCQPAALTLARQSWRLVDNVLLESPAVAERFLAYWRASGHQRVGYLLGRYEPHPDVPLGDDDRPRDVH